MCPEVSVGLNYALRCQCQGDLLILNATGPGSPRPLVCAILPCIRRSLSSLGSSQAYSFVVIKLGSLALYSFLHFIVLAAFCSSSLGSEVYDTNPYSNPAIKWPKVSKRSLLPRALKIGRLNSLPDFVFRNIRTMLSMVRLSAIIRSKTEAKSSDTEFSPIADISILVLFLRAQWELKAYATRPHQSTVL